MVNQATYTSDLGRFVNKGIDYVIEKKRREMFDKIFSTHVDLDQIDSYLDIGSTSDTQRGSSNYFVKNLPGQIKKYLFSDQMIETEGLPFEASGVFSGDACAMDFEDNNFDTTLSSAVIEHVGTFERQLKMARESVRISAKHSIITTPNRWHPIEFHTRLPFIHWLPKKLHRKFLNTIGLEFFSLEENLNLLDKKDLTHIAQSLKHDNLIKDYKILHIRLLGFISNYVVVIHK